MRRLVVVLSGLITSLALVTSAPREADAAPASCPISEGWYCAMQCPSNPVAGCNYFYRHFGCNAVYGVCDRNDYVCTVQPCCDPGSGSGCDGTNPYCTPYQTYCYFNA